jgi:outer membrane PBP1 activator LpoA protein
MKAIYRCAFFLCAVMLLSHCGSSVVAPKAGDTPVPGSATDNRTINELLMLAANTDSPQAERYILQASAMALRDGDPDNAAAILSGIILSGTKPSDELPMELAIEATRQQAELALLRDDAQYALTLANSRLLERTAELPADARRSLMRLRATALVDLEQYLAAVREHTRMAETLTDPEQIVDNNNRIWQILTGAPAGSLNTEPTVGDSYELRGWLELISVVNSEQNNIERQVAAITRWQNRWNRHTAALSLPDALAFAVELLNNRPQHIALMLPLGEAAGRAVNEGFMAAYYHAVGQNQQVPEVEVIDTTGVRDVAILYQRAVALGVDMIIGPLLKESVRQLQSLEQLPVPTLALNYGDDWRINPTGFYQFGLAPEDEIRQAARMARQAGHRYAAVLTPAGEDYRRIQDGFVEYWEAIGGEVVSRASFGSVAGYSDIITQLMSIDASEARAERLREVLPRNNIEFTPRRRQDVDFIFMLANPAEGRQLKPTMAFHFVGDVPVYAMPAIYDGRSDTTVNRDLNGITFVDAPWVLGIDDPLRASIGSVWSPATGPVKRLRAMGIDSFRLYARISQLENFPDTRLQGATGILSMREDGTIMRDLMGARFIDGNILVLLPETQVPEGTGN